MASCATQGTSQAELSSLRAELRSLQDENARLARRVELLEAGRAASAGSSGPREVPALTVVKLKPKADPAPKVSLSVPVVEPPADVVAQILEAPPAVAPRGSSKADDLSLDAEYAEGLAALRTGNVSGGIGRLQRFAAQNPRHPKADNALYFAGVGLMAQSAYEEAAASFERLLASYPASDEAQSAMLKLAECRLRLKNGREARAVYTQVVNKYPGSAAANEATQRLAALPP